MEWLAADATMRRVRLTSDARLAFGLLLLSVAALGTFLFVGFRPLRSRALRSPAAEPAPVAPLAGTTFGDATDAIGLGGWRHELQHGVRSILDAVAPGIGLLDLDQDSDLDLVLLTGSAAPTGVAILLNQLVPSGKAHFVDATAACGITWRGAAQGVCAGDVDADGDVDLYVTALGGNLLLKSELIEQGELSFRDVTADAGVAGGRWHWQQTDPKRPPTARAGAPPPTLPPEQELPEFSTGCTFGDLDADGDLDLYVANYVSYFEARWALSGADEAEREARREPARFKPQIFESQDDRLFLNEGADAADEDGAGDLLFRDVSRAAGVDDDDGRGMGALFVRVDGDDYPDLYVANDASDNVFFHNVAAAPGDRNGLRRRFADTTVEFGLNDPNSGMGIARGDADGDADLDLLTTNWRFQSASLFLFRREERVRDDGSRSLEPFFDERGDAAGLGGATSPFVGWGCVFFDYDNDGDEDIFVGNGFTSPRQSPLACLPEKPLLFQNLGAGRFADVTASAGNALLRTYSARGVVSGDVDQDGDLDLLLAQNHGPVVYLENRLPSDGRPSLTVAVRIGALRAPEAVPGEPPARTPIRGDAVNALVVVDVGGKKLVRELVSGGSYLSQGPFEAHFGLGRLPRADELRVQWPTPRARKLPPETNVPAGRVVVETPRER